MAQERHTLKGWASRLSVADEPLTREEALLLAMISCNDRLVEIQVALEDLKERYRLLDHWLTDAAPGYRAPRHLKALVGEERS